MRRAVPMMIRRTLTVAQAIDFHEPGNTDENEKYYVLRRAEACGKKY